MYEYRCKGCGNEWEERQGIKDPPTVDCPKCECETAERMISRPGLFVLKGAGFHCNDYGKGSGG